MPPRRPQGKQKLPSKQAIQKKPPVVEDDTEAVDKFKVELKWCVQQIEAAMQKASLKEKEDMAKAHRTLTNTKAPHIKKRQVMNSLFGDYRAKMAEEESKIKIEMPKMKKQSIVPGRSVFFRKSAEHFPITTIGPLANSQDGDDEKNQVAEGIDPIILGSGSTLILNTEELGENRDDESFSGRAARNSSEGNVGEFEKIASCSFKFPIHSGSTFKFNFSPQ